MGPDVERYYEPDAMNKQQGRVVNLNDFKDFMRGAELTSKLHIEAMQDRDDARMMLLKIGNALNVEYPDVDSDTVSETWLRLGDEILKKIGKEDAA